jgi:hypothetical protein
VDAYTVDALKEWFDDRDLAIVFSATTPNWGSKCLDPFGKYKTTAGVNTV